MLEMKISIPLDKDGFVELECDYCKNRFMLHESVYSDELNLYYFCPICGLPNDINTFYCPEILELMRQKSINYLNDELHRQLGAAIRKFNKNGFIKMTYKTPKKETENELYTPITDYVLFHQKCCSIDVKALELDIQVGLYCPICGGSTL